MNGKLDWMGSVRSIVTVFLTITFCYLAFISKISENNMMAVLMLVLGFYFGMKDRPVAPNSTVTTTETQSTAPVPPAKPEVK
jgi:hypothetical protein